ncbi:MAG: YggS family pyridoxal phosphate enzyme [Deltaproteobacteria bacterium GWA2_38_16]|nr:MAG: YggS family pyridoxal phosphate enzyme [Deltaproteobacteria bacterium GWA2_38_16]OGQ02085.1 MAG: YggS family pyridoxal phosphate enzyme [Deltaproteobacteria bacterium RIFCSPHIGHO2_02_FULL_38_15]OGQ32531.1 MAG: YggS family pyridoxal phosphate enzyme [Deltaproteobacteria bacterium RIFCSPLOWO2_01_FULL_38_9]OGQ63062.1 MAG: YggS family pyridoxal phosphate enzyme [Deltaproteobacteria bacterium RIFCSPLOWO2_12_FULL_38_8]HBQ21623.1 YggS family pyridoxal phosphate-dependent enzyme [Deltaproteobac
MSDIKKNIETIQNIISEYKRPITLIGVTKNQPLEKIKEAMDAGLTHFGENYAQEFLEKWKPGDDIQWHFIGHLQTNKVKYIIDKVASIQSVDSLKLFQTIHKEVQKINRVISVFIEVNIGEEPSKSGVLPQNLSSFLTTLPKSPYIEVVGLMTIPPHQEDPEKMRPYFKKIAALQKETQLKELSMGMSHDFKIALEEGATYIRIGEAIFGKRL